MFKLLSKRITILSYFGRKQCSSYYGRGGSHDSGFGRSRSAPGADGRWSDGAGSRLRPVTWDRTQLAPITKDIYQEHPTIAQRDNAEIMGWLKENKCTLDGGNIPRPIFEFDESGFEQPIVDVLQARYERPTIIQSFSWPVALTGRDMIAISQTGSGKTLGFILPAIMHTLSQQQKRRPGVGPSVLVLLPTRELAIQVEEVARDFCAAVGLKLTCCYGGAPKQSQGRALHFGVDICVSTPGRILDFLEGSVTNMRRCTFLVLDEADRMLDMGFEPQIRKIVGQIRPDRQTLMFSATWPKEVRELAADFQTKPVFLNVGSLELAANPNIRQIVEVIDEYSKGERLMELMREMAKEPDYKVLIFVGTKRKADELTQQMRQNGLSALSIHGDKEQRQREWVLSEFRSGKVPIVIATEVAARGLDVNDIKYVVNYDYPNDSEMYVHRIGRTARQGKTGTSYTFFTPYDAQKAKDLIKVLEGANQEVPDELRELTNPNDAFRENYGGTRFGRGRGRNFD